MDSPFDGLPVPPLDRALLDGYHEARLRCERIKDMLHRAILREVGLRRRLREEAPGDDEAIRRELDRLTPEKRLASLSTERRRCLAVTERLSLEAWRETQTRHPDVARLWREAYHKLMPPEAQGRLVDSGVFEHAWFERQIGESLLAMAAHRDRASKRRPGR